LELSRSTYTDPWRTVMAGPTPLGREPPRSPETPMDNRSPVGCRQRLAAEPRAGDSAHPRTHQLRPF